MTANVIPFPHISNSEPIISADYFGSEKFILSDIFSLIDSINSKDK